MVTIVVMLIIAWVIVEILPTLAGLFGAYLAVLVLAMTWRGIARARREERESKK